MSFLSKAKAGRIEKPQIFLFFSSPGVGKTTFASKFEGVLLVDLEDGSRHIDVRRISSEDIPDYTSLLKLLEELQQSPNDVKTLVLDSVGVVEAYIHRHLCGTKYESIESVDGGFGRGYSLARAEAQKLMATLRNLSNKMDVILLAHSQVKKFTDPVSNATYDRYVIQTNEKFAEILTSASDNVFFFKHNVSTVVDQKTKKTQAFLSGERVMMTEWSPAYEAKNRLGLIPQLPLDYKVFRQAIENAKPKSADELRNQIKLLLLKADAQTQTLAVEKVKEAGDSIESLMRISSRLSQMVAA